MNRDMNFFRPFASKRRGENTQYDKYVYLFAGVVLLVIIVTLAYNSIVLFSTKSDIEDYTAKYNDAEFQAKLQESDKVNDQLDKISKYEEDLAVILKAVDSRDVVTTTVVNAIKSTLPTDVSIDSLKINNSQIVIAAKSKSMEPISEFEHNLAELPFAAGAYISGITGEEDARAFNVVVTLKEVK